MLREADASRPAEQLPYDTSALAVSPDGRRLAVRGTDGDVHLLAVADGRDERRLVAGGPAARVGWAAGGPWLVSGKKSGFTVWNADSGVAGKQIPGWFDRFDMLPDGQRAVTVAGDNVWVPRTLSRL